MSVIFHRWFTEILRQGLFCNVEDIFKHDRKEIFDSSFTICYSYTWLLLLTICCWHCMALKENGKKPVPAHSSHSAEVSSHSKGHLHSKEHSHSEEASSECKGT